MIATRSMAKERKDAAKAQGLAESADLERAHPLELDRAEASPGGVCSAPPRGGELLQF